MGKTEFCGQEFHGHPGFSEILRGATNIAAPRTESRAILVHSGTTAGLTSRATCAKFGGILKQTFIGNRKWGGFQEWGFSQ